MMVGLVFCRLDGVDELWSGDHVQANGLGSEYPLGRLGNLVKAVDGTATVHPAMRGTGDREHEVRRVGLVLLMLMIIIAYTGRVK